MAEPPTTTASVRDVVAALGENATIFDVSAKTPEQAEDRKHRHRVESGILIFGGVVVVIVMVYAMFGFWSSNAELQKASATLLTSILTGVLGFFAGRGLKS